MFCNYFYLFITRALSKVEWFSGFVFLSLGIQKDALTMSNCRESSASTLIFFAQYTEIFYLFHNTKSWITNNKFLQYSYIHHRIEYMIFYNNEKISIPKLMQLWFKSPLKRYYIIT